MVSREGQAPTATCVHLWKVCLNKTRLGRANVGKAEGQEVKFHSTGHRDVDLEVRASVAVRAPVLLLAFISIFKTPGVFFKKKKGVEQIFKVKKKKI